MKRSFTLVGFLLVLSLGLVVACDTNTTQFVSPGEAVFDLADFAETLFNNGVPIELGSPELFDFFPFPALHFTIFGQDVLVFELAGPGSAIVVANAISEDGTTVNGRVIDWPATPHFFREGRIVVLYLGDDPQVLSTLTAFLGPQFAGGESAPQGETTAS